ECDDGYNVPAVATVSVQVSDARLIKIYLPAISLIPGTSQKLLITGDFEDEKGVDLHPSYLTFSTLDPLVASVDPAGSVAALKSGWTVLLADRDNIRGVRAIVVADPFAEDEGHDTGSPFIYPGSLAFVPLTGVRQLQVSTSEGFDITPASAGTLYFTSNSGVVQVSTDGFAQTGAEGEAIISVINGGFQADVPVSVSEPHVGATILGAQGGVVAGSGGTLLTIGPDVLRDPKSVSIGAVAVADLPLAVPSAFNLLGAFSLDLGGAVLDQPVQVAIAAPASAVAGEIAYFFRKADMP